MNKEQERLFDQAAKLGEDALPETLFGFTYWSHMIPPRRPEQTLILSNHPERIAALIRRFWGYDISILSGQASTKFTDKFDFICIDLWTGAEPANIIFMPEFMRWISELCPRVICANVRTNVGVNKRHEDMDRLRHNFEDRGPFQFEHGDLIGDNVVLWWSIKQEA